MPGSEPHFSLVVATLGRVQDVGALLQSLLTQQPGVEVILVDQNGDDRLDQVVAAFAGSMDIQHVRAEPRNSSYARNVGIALCTGDIIGFPDDDCIYPDGVLARVGAAFGADPTLGVLTGVARRPDGELRSGRWAPAQAAIGMANAFTTVICFSLFLRLSLLTEIGGFDERLGVGAVHGSCEENDLVLCAIGAGARAVYDPALAVVHPDKRLTRTALARAFRYGAGVGFVLRKHGFGWRVIAIYLVRPLGGMLLSGLRLRWLACAYYWQTLRGRLFGYFTYSAE